MMSWYSLFLEFILVVGHCQWIKGSTVQTTIHRSEVAYLRQQIEAEYQAAQQALSGIAIAGRHAFITARQENIGKCFEMLSTLMASEEAIKIGAQTLEHIGEERAWHVQSKNEKQFY